MTSWISLAVNRKIIPLNQSILFSDLAIITQSALKISARILKDPQGFYHDFTRTLQIFSSLKDLGRGMSILKYLEES